MNIYNVLPLIAFFSNTALALYILYRNPGGRLNRLYSLAMFSLAAWSIGEFLSFTSSTPEAAAYLDMISRSGSALLAAALIHFFLAFTKSGFVEKKRNALVLYLPYVFFQSIILLARNLITESAEASYWGYSMVRGPIYLPLMLYITTFTIVSILLCYRFYLKAGSNEKIQARLFMLIMIIPLVGGILTEIVLPAIGFKILPLTTLLSILAGLIVAYAIARRGLMSPMSFSIRRKTATIFLLFIVFFCAVTFSLEGFFTTSTLDSQIKDHLETITQIKTNWIDSYLSDRESDISLLASSSSVSQSFNTRLTAEVELAKDYEDYFMGFMENYGYHDMFLISAGGEIWWAAKDKEEIGKGLGEEPHNQTTLASAYRESIKEGKASYGYGISDETDGILFLISVPVYIEGRLAGAIALQTDTEDINGIMEDRTGLGETGESYLVGTDYLMRSNSRFHEESTILKLRVETENARNCFMQKTLPEEEIRKMHSEIMIANNYMGTSVLGAHAYIPEMDMCLLVEISEAEVFAPISEMQQSLLIYFIVLVILGVLVSLLISGSITKPIVRLRDIAIEMGKGKLNTKIPVKTRDEIGELASAFRRMARNLRDSQKEIEKRAEELEMRVKERTKQLDSRVSELTDTKTAVLNMMEDVDRTNMELMKTQEQLKKSLAELEEVDVKKNQFISIAAHELKTPLTSIHGFSQLLLNKKVSEKVGMRDKYLKIMDHETKRLSDLVDDILDLSRIDMGTMKFNIEIIDMNELLDSIRKEAEILIKKKGLEPEYEIAGKLPKVRTDPEKITQILINLVNNAAKYTPKGKVVLGASREGQKLHLFVKDTGIGIPKGKQKKIFERFYQIDSSYTRGAGGTGLGLALCKEFIEMLGGEIYVKSEPNIGSEFHVMLPIRAALKKGAKERARESIKKAENLAPGSQESTLKWPS